MFFYTLRTNKIIFTDSLDNRFIFYKNTQVKLLKLAKITYTKLCVKEPATKPPTPAVTTTTTTTTPAAPVATAKVDVVPNYIELTTVATTEGIVTHAEDAARCPAARLLLELLARPPASKLLGC